MTDTNQKQPPKHERDALETLVGDLVDGCVQALISAGAELNIENEDKARELRHYLGDRVADSARKAVRTLAAEGFESVTAVVEQVVFKGGGAKVVLTGKGGGFHSVADMTDCRVQIVIVEPILPLENRQATPDDNQGDLPLEPDPDEPDDAEGEGWKTGADP